MTIVKADSPICETTRGQGKVSSAEPPASVAQLPNVTSSSLKKGLEGPIQPGNKAQPQRLSREVPAGKADIKHRYLHASQSPDPAG